MTEAELLHQILLAIGGRPDCRVWRVNTGVARDPVSGRCVRFGQPGGADVQGLVAPHGRFLALEVKSKSGQVSHLGKSASGEKKALPMPRPQQSGFLSLRELPFQQSVIPADCPT